MTTIESRPERRQAKPHARRGARVNRIANADGAFWEPFPWGEPEMAYINELFRTADTLVLSRAMYEAIVPWWDTVAAGQVPENAVAVSAADKEFAKLQKEMTEVVFSRSLSPPMVERSSAGTSRRSSRS